jgi:hypothetical protein
MSIDRIGLAVGDYRRLFVSALATCPKPWFTRPGL